MKVCYFDLETSGLSYTKNGIIEAAFIIEIDGQVIEEQLFKMNPVGAEIDQRALDINGYTKSQVDSFNRDTIVKEEIYSLLDRHIDKYNKNDKFAVAGYNVDFDVKFLENLWKKAGDKYFWSYFSPVRIDAFKLLGFLEYAGKLKVNGDRSLFNVCINLGIQLRDAHSALGDIRASRELVQKMLDMIK